MTDLDDAPTHIAAELAGATGADTDERIPA